MPIDYDDRRFTSHSNSTGGEIAHGTLIARVLKDGSLDMRYQHVTLNGAVKTGRCASTPEILIDGRIRLHEQWQWTEGGTGSGESIVEEITANV